MPNPWVGLPLQLELIGGRGKQIWRTMEKLSYSSSLGLCSVHAGWVTDLTSIPWWLIWKRREGTHTPASVVHDWCYAKGYVIKGPGGRLPITRKQADDIYLEAMRSLGVGRRLSWVIHRGVRLGAWAIWSRYRRRDD